MAIIIEFFEDGSLLLTSSAFVKPLSSLWRIGETQEHMINFPDEYFVEFNKTVQDRIIGTQGSKATVFFQLSFLLTLEKVRSFRNSDRLAESLSHSIIKLTSDL